MLQGFCRQEKSVKEATDFYYLGVLHDWSWMEAADSGSPQPYLSRYLAHPGTSPGDGELPSEEE